jgi:hypothetical protein
MSLVNAQEAVVGQVTVRGVDPRMGRALKDEARRRGLSVNRTVLALLREAIGIEDEPARGRRRTYDDLDPLAGTWKSPAASKLLGELERQRGIDAGLWR